MLIAKQLNFDVTSAADEFFDEYLARAECGLGLAICACSRFADNSSAELHDAHPPPSAAVRCLEHYRIAQCIGDRGRLGGGFNGRLAAGQNRNACLGGKLAGRKFCRQVVQALLHAGRQR